MIRLIQCELIKLKRNAMVLVLMGAAILSPALNALIFLNYPKMEWGSFFHQTLLFISMLMGPMMFGLIISYVFGREFVEGTSNNLLTAPAKREKIVLAKLVVTLLWSAFLAVLTWLATIGFGMLVGVGPFPTEFAGTYLVRGLISTLLICMPIPITGLVAVMFRGYIPPMAFAAGSTLVGLVAVQSPKWSVRMPWSIPDIYLTTAKVGEVLPISCLIILASVFMAGTLALTLYVRFGDYSK